MSKDKPQQNSTYDTNMTNEEMLREDLENNSQEDSITDESY